ncbi:MAG: hypothetical protein FJW88_14760 [Actinobacteria bacterium]|nr:hypothetical protein [Actinomycetota bacterium]
MRRRPRRRRSTRRGPAGTRRCRLRRPVCPCRRPSGCAYDRRARTRCGAPRMAYSQSCAR